MLDHLLGIRFYEKLLLPISLLIILIHYLLVSTVAFEQSKISRLQSIDSLEVNLFFSLFLSSSLFFGHWSFHYGDSDLHFIFKSHSHLISPSVRGFVFFSNSGKLSAILPLNTHLFSFSLFSFMLSPSLPPLSLRTFITPCSFLFYHLHLLNF